MDLISQKGNHSGNALDSLKSFIRSLKSRTAVAPWTVQWRAFVNEEHEISAHADCGYFASKCRKQVRWPQEKEQHFSPASMKTLKTLRSICLVIHNTASWNRNEDHPCIHLSPNRLSNLHAQHFIPVDKNTEKNKVLEAQENQ